MSNSESELWLSRVTPSLLSANAGVCGACSVAICHSSRATRAISDSRIRRTSVVRRGARQSDSLAMARPRSPVTPVTWRMTPVTPTATPVTPAPIAPPMTPPGLLMRSTTMVLAQAETTAEAASYKFQNPNFEFEPQNSKFQI